MTTVFSGIQPTGSLHLGNYMGAIKNWKPLIEKNQCIFCIVDMHAITMPYDKSLLHENIRKTLSSYIACGIDPSKTIIFKQSDVNEHTELAWILSCIVQYGKINGMIQFKEKSKQNSQKVSLGLYTYPILMAADILLYKTNYVPVGEDQTQHIELTREVASTFNKRYETTFFPIPSIITNKNSARIMSLKDGTKKMSKSDPSKHSRINLDDTPDEIKEKISKATTDSFDYVDYDTVNRPSLSN
uniref:tryptophan--tRNA ligase n=1 Tax=Biomphalaria glabrata TaxID=6526 RepID=A0A2C9L2M7_BIOGL